MGNSETICKRHYLREVANVATKEFWNIRPTNNEVKMAESSVVSPPIDRNVSEKIATPNREISVTC